MAKNKSTRNTRGNRAARRSGNPAVRNEVQDKPTRRPESAEAAEYGQHEDVAQRENYRAKPIRRVEPEADFIETDEDGEDWFVYPAGDGTITLPLLDDMPVGITRKVRNLEEGDAMFAILELLCDDEELELVDSLKQSEFKDMYKAWNEASGVSMGESSGSSR